MPVFRKLSSYSALVVFSGLFVLAGCNSSPTLNVADTPPSTPPPASTPAPAPASTPAPNPLTISTTSLAATTVGYVYSAPVAVSGGTAPYSFSASGLPTGLTISSTTGTISGTPAVGTAGTPIIVVTVIDSTQPTSLIVSATYLLTINSAPFVPAPAAASCLGSSASPAISSVQ
jgi:hypothetical protein